MFVDAKGAQAPLIGCACLCAPHRLHGERGGCLFGRLRLFRKLSTFYRLCVLLGAIASGGRNCQAAGKASCCCTQCVQCCVTPGTLCFPRVSSMLRWTCSPGEGPAGRHEKSALQRVCNRAVRAICLRAVHAGTMHGERTRVREGLHEHVC